MLVSLSTSIVTSMQIEERVRGAMAWRTREQSQEVVKQQPFPNSKTRGILGKQFFNTHELLLLVECDPNYDLVFLVR
eukprot:1832906-Amphidinium_carterae.1